MKQISGVRKQYLYLAPSIHLALPVPECTLKTRTTLDWDVDGRIKGGRERAALHESQTGTGSGTSAQQARAHVHDNQSASTMGVNRALPFTEVNS